MSELNILVTGVGAIIGHGIIKSLRALQCDIKIIGIDLHPNAYGKHWCNNFYSKPSVIEDDNYFCFINELIVKENIDLILPGIEQDVNYFNEKRSYFETVNVKIALNRKDLITVSLDKWLIYKKLKDTGIPAIPTKIDGNWQEYKEELGPPPLLMKPRCGSGSRGIVEIENEDDFIYQKKKADHNFVIQKIVGTDEEEFTVGVFGFDNGYSLPPIIFRRKLSGLGSTQFAEVVFDESIVLMVERLNQIFHPVGPTNYQFRKEGEIIYLLEVNPRISSSTSLRVAFGYNESGMCIDYYLFGKRPAEPNIVNGTAFRYMQDYILL